MRAAIIFAEYCSKRGAAAFLLLMGTLFALLLGVTGTAWAYPGDLDTSFSGDGKATTNFVGGQQTNTDDEARDMAIQSDGKIVAVGLATDSSNSEMDFALARYNTNGILDGSFDGDGRVSTSFDESPGLAVANAVDIQEDGKIVVAGFVGGVFEDENFALARYNPDGSLDTSFDGDGKIVTSIDPTVRKQDRASDLVIQPDGKIVAVGESNTAPGFQFKLDFAVVRYNPDGSLDTSFGGDGKLTTPFGSAGSAAEAVALQENGKIVAAGGGALARYNADGSLDGSFGGDGKVFAQLAIFDVALQEDGKIAAAGITNDPNVGLGSFRVTLARYNPNGARDASFGKNGTVISDLFPRRNDAAFALTVQPDGKLLVAGKAPPPSSDFQFMAARYMPNGSFDGSFGSCGTVFTQFGPDDGREQANAVAIQEDGNIVVAGSTGGGANFSDFALARYLVAPPLFSPPTITTPSRNISYDNDGIFTLAGTTAVRGDVWVHQDGEHFGTVASVPAGGSWDFRFTGVPNGRHVYTAKSAIFRAAQGSLVSCASGSRTVIVDTIEPRVRSTNPLTRATGVAPGTNVTAAFSEAMRAGTVNKAFQLYQNGSATPISATVSYDPATKRATLNPSANLKRGATYKAEVGSAARDLAGNPLDQNPTASGNQAKTWTFTVTR